MCVKTLVDPSAGARRRGDNTTLPGLGSIIRLQRAAIAPTDDLYTGLPQAGISSSQDEPERCLRVLTGEALAHKVSNYSPRGAGETQANRARAAVRFS